MGIVCGRQAGLPVKNWRVLRISNIKVQKNVKEEAMSDDNESIRKKVAVKKRAVGSKFRTTIYSRSKRHTASRQGPK